MAATLLYNASLSSLNLPDGVVIDMETPATGALVPGAINSICWVGTATLGEFDAQQEIGSTTEQVETIGLQTVNNTDLGTAVNAALNSGISDNRVVRVGDGTQSAAVIAAMGASSSFGSFLAISEGSYITGSALLTYNINTPTAQQKTSGNTQKVYVDLTLTSAPTANAEIYLALDGNVAVTADGETTYSIDPVALGNAIAAAVNNGQANGMGKSQYFIFSVSSSASTAGAPIIATANPVSTAGTDGATFAAGSPLSLDAAMLGTNESVAFTGMYAHSNNMSGSLLVLVGETNMTVVAATALAFAKSGNAHYVTAFPNGTSTSSAIATKAGLALGDWSMTIMAGDWCQYTDTVNGAITRFVDPSVFAAIRIALTAVPDSPANLPIALVTGTYRTGTFQNNPYSTGSGGETNQLENAGINFVTRSTAGNVGWALAHNKNSLGKAASPRYMSNIAYGRVLQYYAQSFNSDLVGQLVGKSQGFSKPDDQLRADARALFNGFGVNDGINDGFVAVCDLTNNAPGKGQIRIDCQITQREIVDIVSVGVVSGVGTFTAINPGQTTPTTS